MITTLLSFETATHIIPLSSALSAIFTALSCCNRLSISSSIGFYSCLNHLYISCGDVDSSRKYREIHDHCGNYPSPRAITEYSNQLTASIAKVDLCMSSLCHKCSRPVAGKRYTCSTCLRFFHPRCCETYLGYKNANKCCRDNFENMETDDNHVPSP